MTAPLFAAMITGQSKVLDPNVAVWSSNESCEKEPRDLPIVVDDERLEPVHEVYLTCTAKYYDK